MSELIDAEWPGTITKQQAINFIHRITDHDDPYWSNMVENYYDEETDTMPSIYDFMVALGITEEEYKEATGAQNVKWPAQEPK